MNVGELKEIIKDLPDDMPIKGLSDPEGNDCNTIHYIEESIWCDDREMEYPLNQIEQAMIKDPEYYKGWDLESLEEWEKIKNDKSKRILMICP